MSLFKRLSDISRRRKLEMFIRILNPTKEMKILDLGSEINPDGDKNLQLIDGYKWKNNISALNISSDMISRIKEYYPEIDGRVGDACDLPWGDKHFDIVYSNAVIEHIGDFERQKKMAAEVMRVGKSWFVTTPNRWFPFEFHMRLPLVTWIPGNGYLWVGKIVSYNHVREKYTYLNNGCSLRLMSYSELKKCFPGSRIVKQRVTLMAETLIAVGGDVIGKGLQSLRKF